MYLLPLISFCLVFRASFFDNILKVFKEKGKDLERESDSLREAFSKRLFENPSELVFFFELFGVRCSMWPNVEGVDQQRVLKLLNPRPKLASRQVPLPNGPPMAFSQLLQSHLQRDKWEVFLKQTASAEGGPREKFLEYVSILCSALLT